MERSDISEMEFQLKKLFHKYSDLFVSQQWPSEHERWVELVFALVTRISNKAEDEIRDAIEDLDDLELLDVEGLSQVPTVSGGIDLDDAHARRIFEYLCESEFTSEESKSSILAVHEAAKSLMDHHDGKIQKYLRKYGQEMINELPQNFSFSKMNKFDIKYAFTYWLQNVLNMPISLEDEVVEQFCRKLAGNAKDLVQAVDKLDINLALVDDIIQSYLADHTPAKGQGLEQAAEKGGQAHGK